MTSRTGNEGFTFIEVMVAVVILSIGLIGVIRAYIVSLSVQEVSQSYIQSVSLAKYKIASLQEQADENQGLALGSSQGNFPEPYTTFTWQAQVTSSKEKDLNTLKLTVADTGIQPVKTFTLTTYVFNKK